MAGAASVMAFHRAPREYGGDAAALLVLIEVEELATARNYPDAELPDGGAAASAYGQPAHSAVKVGLITAPSRQQD